MNAIKSILHYIPCLNTSLCTAGLFIVLVSVSRPAMAQVDAQSVREKVRHLTTTDGVEFGLWGGGAEKSPAPLLFILASSIDETLGSEYFRQSGNRLAREHGWLCVSIDLPAHGKLKTKEGPQELLGWAQAIRKGEDFITANNTRMRQVLDYLIANGYADKEKIALCGTSRGGYLALQFASVEPRVKSVAAFAPATNLSVIKEFADIKKDSLLPIYSLDGQVAALSGKWIWIVIGDRDTRVTTEEAIRLARNITRAAAGTNDQGGVELNVMYEPKGHTTPEGSVDRSVDWLLKRTSKQ